MMGLIWVLLFPLGAVIIRFLGNVTKNAVGKHRIVQISALVLLLIATGVGVYLAWGHQFTAFRNSPPSPPTNPRSFLRRQYCRRSSRPSRFRSLPPRPVRQRPSNSSSLVHPCPSLARPHRHPLRRRKLRIRSAHREPTLQRRTDLVDRMWCARGGIFLWVCDYAVGATSSGKESAVCACAGL